MDRRQEKKDISYESPIFIDSLTNLYNRYFLHHIFPKLKEETKSSGAELAVFMLDIDNFKYVNDSYGHLRGDSVIKEVGSLLKECVRGDDLVIRYAGDEYVVLCKGAGYDLSKIIGERINEKINKNVFKAKTGEPEIHLTISGGFAVCPRDAEGLEELIDYADKALYFSKDRGKNRISPTDEVTLGTITYKETIKILSLPKFINRLPEINRLKEIRKDTLSSRVFLVLIKGEMGVGKSRLLDEFQDSLSSSGVETLKIICSQQHTLQPYYVLSEGIEEHLKKASSRLSFDSFLSQEELGALAELLPSLKKLIETRGLPEGKIAPEPTRLGIKVFNGLRRILMELSRHGGLFLNFDDIQWLDKATFELLKYFLTIESAYQIMIAGTFCVDELTDEQLPSKDFLSKLSHNFVSLDLLPFSLEQTQEFIASSFPNINALTEFSLSAYNITHGNCLFTQEILKCLVEDSKILYKDNQWQLLEPEHLDIPTSLEEVIQRRLKRIDPETKEMLTQAAVMGRDVQLETLRRIIAKDQGHLFDLIDQARDKGLLSPQKKIDKVNFTNDFTQKAIYEDIEAGQKVGLHRKAEEIIKDLNKDDFGGVIADLIYHAQGAGEESKAVEYKNRLLGTSLDLFNLKELTSYLEELSKEVVSQRAIPYEAAIERIETEISEETLIKVIDFIRSLLAALKTISLYPPTNRIREESVKKVYERVKEMLKGIPSLTFSELERILLVNGKRPPHRQEKEAASESFIALMSEKDIKAIQFLPGVEDKEINALITALSQETDDLRKEGGLVGILTQQKVNNIKIDTADYGRLAVKKVSHPIQERLSNVMLLDFLLGKTPEQKIAETAVLAKKLKEAPQAFAKDLVEATKVITQQSGLKAADTHAQAKIIAEGIEKITKEVLPGGLQAHREDLVRLFSSLDKPLQSDLISLVTQPQKEGMDTMREVVSSLSESEVVDAITSGYNKDKDPVPYINDLFNKLTVQPERKEKIKPLLEEKLKEMGLGEAEISFATQKEYKSLTLDEKLDTLFKLPPELYHSFDQDNIKALIVELVSAGRKDNLKALIMHLMAQLEKAPSSAKEIIYQILGDFINLVPPSSYEFDTIILEVFLPITRRIEEEGVPLYPLLLGDIEIALNWVVSSVSSLELERWIMRQRFISLSNLILALYKELEANMESEEISRKKELIRDLLFRFSKSGLIEVLIQQLEDPSLDYNSTIEELILKFGASSLDVLIKMITQTQDSSFESYLYRRKISNILLRMDKTALDKIKNYIAIEKDPIKLRLLIEVIGYEKGAELMDVLQSLISHNDPKIRKEVVLILSNIVDSRSIKLLSEMSKDTEATVAHLAKTKLEILKRLPKIK
jgi:diguanylate cyclase (GGDEF)-like protein